MTERSKKVVTLTVNGETIEALVEPHRTLVDFLRRDLGLTGTKKGCNLGECGACTVLIDGKPALSCLTLVASCEGKVVETIEGLSRGGKLHPIQAAFIEHGAVQCGFCTPGMIMSAKALVDSNIAPPDGTGEANVKQARGLSEDQVRKGMSGNLCRCTGYAKIVDAVMEASEMVREADRTGEVSTGRSLDGAVGEESPSGVLSQGTSSLRSRGYSVLGKNLPRVDAELKVKGQAKYVDDIVLPGMLYGKFLRSTVAHAKILNIDTSKAERVVGVRDIATGADIPVTFGIVPQKANEHPLAFGKVRYFGEPVAVVAATSEEAAEEAVQLIKVDYEELPVLLDPLEAMNSETRIHEGPGDFGVGNIDAEAFQEFGNLERAFEEADYVREDTFKTQMVNHAFLEPHGVVAHFDLAGNLTVYSSTQIPHYLHRTLAQTLGVPMSKVRIAKTFVGGAFGGKAEPLYLDIVAGFMAKKTGLPVKITHSREEVFFTHRGRHPVIVNLKTGVKRDGTLLAMEYDTILDGGAYSGWGVVVLYYMASLIHAPYRIPNVRFKGKRVFTNKPPMGAQRGLAGVQPRFAIESQLDMIAEELGIDPIELRLKNAVYSGYETKNERKITSCGFAECLDHVARASSWREKKGKLPAGRGIGVAGGWYISGTVYTLYPSDRPHSTAIIKVEPEGGLSLFTGACDIGQGSDTVLAMIAAEVLGIPLDEIHVYSMDTSITPMDLGSFSSRVTFGAGNAVKKAAEAVKAKLFDELSRVMEVSPRDLVAREGRIHVVGSPERGMSFKEAVEIYSSRKGIIIGEGSYTPPKLGGKFKGGKVGPSPTYSFSAQVAEVEVDLKTGKVRVIKITEASDCGFAINPMAVEGQVEGSIQMGLGQALYERVVLDGSGRILNPSFLDYKMPVAADMPEIESIIVESNDEQGPFGAKEVGEGAIQPVIPAILNAIYDATGARIRELPVSFERVVGEMERSKLRC